MLLTENKVMNLIFNVEYNPLILIKGLESFKLRLAEGKNMED